MKDVAPGYLVTCVLFLVILACGLAIAWLPAGHARTRRSLGLLIGLVAAFGALTQVLSLPLSAGASLVVFLGVFWVIHQLGKFEGGE